MSACRVARALLCPATKLTQLVGLSNIRSFCCAFYPSCPSAVVHSNNRPPTVLHWHLTSNQRTPNITPGNPPTTAPCGMHSNITLPWQRPLHVPITQFHTDSEGFLASADACCGCAGWRREVDRGADDVSAPDCSGNRVSVIAPDFGANGGECGVFDLGRLWHLLWVCWLA